MVSDYALFCLLCVVSVRKVDGQWLDHNGSNIEQQWARERASDTEPGAVRGNSRNGGSVAQG